jgi:hypothetical protein
MVRGIHATRAARACAVCLFATLAAIPAAAQRWSVDVLDPSAVDPNSTGAVTPASDLPAAADKPQNLGLFPMGGTADPPPLSMAQYTVFVRNGRTLADWPESARGRIALVKITDPAPATFFAQIANNGAAAGAVAVIFLSNTENPTAIAAPIPAANIRLGDGELLIDRVSEQDPPNGTLSAFPARINPFYRLPQPVAVPATPAAYRGTRIAPGVTPDFDGNPNVPAPYGGPALQTVIHQVGREAAEPTLGVNKDGTAFYAAATFDGAAQILPRTLVMRSRDGGVTWQSVSPELPPPLKSEPPVNGDPMVYVDVDTGRVFSLDTYDADCMWLLYSDDEGASWSRNPIVCDVTPAVTDHQTIFTGPPPPGLDPALLLYPNVLYTCFNTVASTNCLRSFDGGLTFSKAGFPYTGMEPDNLDAPFPFFGVPGFCGGLTTHLRTDAQGRVFLPAGRCGLPSIAVSEDGAMTWERIFVSRQVPLPGVAGVPGGDNEHENTTAVDAAGNLYMTWWDHNDRLPYLATSRDHGRTWSQPLMIAPPGVQEVNFPTIDAGDEGRIVLHFPGTTVADRSDGRRPWNLYQVVSTNALDPDPLFVFTSANDPAEPIHRGNCGPGRCAGMFDFLDVVVPPAEAPDFAQGFWAAGVDTCRAECEQGTAGATRMDGIVIRQLAGPVLRARPIRIEDDDPAVEYRHGWHLVEGEAGASGGGYHRRVGANKGVGADPSARLVFQGDGITYFYATSTRGGTADVLIDGARKATVSYAGDSEQPSFGPAASIRFEGLGDGTHEIVIAYRTGIAYVDAFEIDPGSTPASADASAALAHSVTQTSSAALSGLAGGVATTTVLSDEATEEVSVIVEGAPSPLLVRLLDPAGALVASGGALLAGSAASGVDAAATAGLYTVQVVDTAGGAGALQISIARTQRAR